MNKPDMLSEIGKYIRTIPDFPKPGIQFKDITPILKQPQYFQYLVNCLCDEYKSHGITKIVAIEARGFIFGGALAAALGVGFVPIRKPGKLPYNKTSVNYQLEYGMDSIEIHNDAINQNDIVLLHDDLLATGGTSKAALQLLEKFQPKSIHLNFIIELDFLKGRENIGHYPVSSLIHF